MNDDVRVASVAEVPPGVPVGVEVDSEAVVLVNVQGEIHAVSGRCSHLGTPLALGSVDGYTLVCCAHLWRYDLRTGVPIWPPIARVAPGYRLRVYRTRIEGDDVYVSRIPGRGGST